MSRLLTKKGFEEWLRNKESNDAIVGFRSTALKCPIANFLREITKNDYVVGSDTFTVRGSDIDKNLPKWAIKFIANIDLNLSRYQVTVKDCFIALGYKMD